MRLPDAGSFGASEVKLILIDGQCDGMLPHLPGSIAPGFIAPGFIAQPPICCTDSGKMECGKTLKPLLFSLR